MELRCIKQSAQRKVYLEAIRILAAFCVIFNHTKTDGYFLFSQRTWGSASFWVYLFFSVFCKIAVPLFFMISGALLLHRDNEPLGKLWKNRIGKNVLIILLFAAGNYLLDLLFADNRPDLSWVAYGVFTGNLNGSMFWYGHLWFLYSYIAFLCCLPFLRAMVKGLDDRYFCYLIVLYLAVEAIIPAAEYLLSENSVRLYRNVMPLWLSEEIIIYPCIGYYLEHRIDISGQRKRIKWLWAAAFAGIAVTGMLIYRKALLTQVLEESTSQNFHKQFVILIVIAVYISVKYLFTQFPIPNVVEKAVLSMGRCTFGIYLIHVMVLESSPLRELLQVMLNMGVNNLIACFIQCGAVFLICYGVTAIARKIPLVKKLL